MADAEIKLRVYITKGDVILDQWHSTPVNGRNELVFGSGISVNGRVWNGLSFECWFDREPRHVTYDPTQRELVLPRNFRR